MAHICHTHCRFHSPALFFPSLSFFFLLFTHVILTLSNSRSTSPTPVSAHLPFYELSITLFFISPLAPPLCLLSFWLLSPFTICFYSCLSYSVNSVTPGAHLALLPFLAAPLKPLFVCFRLSLFSCLLKVLLQCASFVKYLDSRRDWKFLTFFFSTPG